MRNSAYIEDIFLDFALLTMTGAVNIQPQDSSPVSSFENAIVQSKKLTQAQANYILKLLTKYKFSAFRAGLDYDQHLKNPQWKTPFRVLDTAKRISVIETVDGVQILIKFPYNLKETFDKAFPDLSSSWDSDAGVRKIDVNDCNVVALAEFCLENGIEVDQTFSDLLLQIEEIWNQEKNIIPQSKILNDQVVLINADEYCQTYFDERKKDKVNFDLFLAKSMGFLLSDISAPSNTFEKIATSPTNIFWVKENKTFFDIYKNLEDSKVVFLLDRNCDYCEEAKKFVISAMENGVDRSDIRVCFRLDTEEERKRNFNSWVKEQGVSGGVDDGKIFIFLHKPAKWLFSKKVDVKIIATNSLWPNTTLGIVNWIESHPCTVYLGDHRPSLKTKTKKEKGVVDL